MTAIAGEFPADQLLRLIPSASYAEKIITGLKKDKLLRIHYRDKLRGYRLTKKSKMLLLDENDSRYSFYLTGNTETNQIRTEAPRRIRLHLKAESYVTFYHAGIPIFPDAKPAIFTAASPKLPLDLKRMPLFYTCREIKALGDDTTKIKNSRNVGILLTPTCIYVIYNTGTSLLKWEYRTEIRVNAFLQHYFNGYGYSGCPQIRAIMLGRDMDTALKLLTSTGGYKKSLFMLDTAFEHFHYIPNTPEGELLLKTLCSPLLTKKLNHLLSSDLLPKSSLAIEHDAMTPEGEAVLFAYDFDMQRINKFNAAAQLFGHKGMLVAFDFQIPVLKDYLGTHIRYSVIDFQKFKRGFFHES
ncbi:MAG: hypothetical protein PHN80_11125 [Hespellia sp.]|nr:hypothetical protein [Hespellia sp.]